MPLPLTVSCFSKIQIGLPFWYRLTRVVLEKGPLNRSLKEVSYLNFFRELFDKIASVFLFEKYINILALKVASPGNRHCASCIGTLLFPIPCWLLFSLNFCGVLSDSILCFMSQIQAYISEI